jgi:transcriptional regulator with XRE-family HTH domain
MPSEPLNNYIRTHRNRAALSQAELATLIGCGSAATVARYELGMREPLLDTALALEVVFGVTPRELFPGRFRTVEQFVRKRVDLLIEEARAAGPSPATTAKLRFLIELRARLTQSE